MKNKLLIFFSLLIITFLGVVCSVLAAADNPKEAIAIKVIANPDHLSPKGWYLRNIQSQGSPQALTVDGYEAIRDGRSVYIAAANISGNNIYTNIYIISYNQDAEKETMDIFGQIIKYWKFNVDLVDNSGPGFCQPNENKSCATDSDCSNNFVCEQTKQVCVKYCTLSSDCPNSMYCDSAKAKLVRDVKRMQDFYEINVALDKYSETNIKYPSLSAGSYLPGKTISVWPSWNDSLAAALGYSLPVDPINKIGTCAGNFDQATCWDEKSKTFATDFKKPVVPVGSLVYVYQYFKDINRYQLCANFETNYVGIPSESRCNGSILGKIPDYPVVKIGDAVTKEGSFATYFQVNSLADIDWAKTEVIPLEPNDWGGWNGWQWEVGATGLKTSAINGITNQRKISARNVNLGSAGYRSFKFAIKVYDINGEYGYGEGNIRICKPIDCAGAGYECGNASNNCGGTLICGDCQAGKTCVGNKCL